MHSLEFEGTTQKVIWVLHCLSSTDVNSCKHIYSWKSALFAHRQLFISNSNHLSIEETMKNTTFLIFSHFFKKLVLVFVIHRFCCQLLILFEVRYLFFFVSHHPHVLWFLGQLSLSFWRHLSGSVTNFDMHLWTPSRHYMWCNIYRTSGNMFQLLL